MNRTFIAALLLVFGLTMLFGWEAGDSVFDTSTWPVTILVVERLLNTPLVPITFVLIAVYAGELVWKEREMGLAEIADALPVAEGTALAGRFLALVAILALLQTPIVFGGILIQALQGYYQFEIGLYVRILFGLNLIHIVILAALAMTIHVVVNHKYLGHIIVVMACVLPIVVREMGYVRHHLLLYGTDPGWRYSDMNGFGPFIGPFVWFKLYWAAWAALLGVAASLFWIRGRELALQRRLREVRARFSGAIVRTAGVAAALVILLGAFIFYNTNILNAYRPPDEAGRERADYEKRYARYKDLAQPTIERAELRIEIYPEQPAVDLRGTYRMVNRTSAAIDSLHIVVDQDVDIRAISFDHDTNASVVDDDVNYRVYMLERALAPGASLQLTFDVSFRPRGFPNTQQQTSVVANGAYFDRRWLPFIGYQKVFELSGEEERRRFGLGPQPALASHDNAQARQYRWSVRNEDLVDFSVVVGTVADQIAVMPGMLRRQWTENPSTGSGQAARHYFHYASDGPMPFSTAVLSAKYAVVEDRWNDVALRIFHHPAHTYVLDRMVRGMKASLAYYTEQFAAYPYRELRIVEAPRYGGAGGRAHMMMNTFAEDVFLSDVREGEIDQPFYGTAHEIAHQWWPGIARSAMVRGHGFLSESLANYSAMMVTEKTYGLEVARRVYDFQMERYLRGRAFQSHEVPLLEVEDQPYIAYRKGAIALYTLREHIGEERVNAALRRFLEQCRNAEPPYPTSLDLYAELRAVTPDSLHSLLTDLFEEITLWDVSTKQALVEPAGNGEYQVMLDVVAKKLRADSAGKETESPMDDLIEIGIFAAGDDKNPIYLQPHRIRSGEQTIRITVPREPTRAGVDPHRKLIERKRDDNMIDVARTSPQRSQ